MVWFRVDDKLHSHKKAMRAGSHALGLWVLAGSWSADQLTDGWVPDYVARNLSVTYEVDAERLVAAGLWQPGESDGDKGWWFHQWAEWGQPSREKTQAARADQRERVRRFRERKREKDQENDGNSGVTRYSDVSNDDGNPPVTVPPSPYPYPSTGGYVPTDDLETLPRKSSRGARGSRLPEGFEVTPEMVEWARVHAPHANGRLETEQFRDYWNAKAGREAVKLDWVATWRTWMRKAEQQAGRPSSRPNGKRTADDKIRRLQAMKDEQPKEIT